MFIKISRETTKRSKAEFIISKLEEQGGKEIRKSIQKRQKRKKNKKQKMAVQIESQNYNGGKKEPHTDISNYIKT